MKIYKLHHRDSPNTYTQWQTNWKRLGETLARLKPGAAVVIEILELNKEETKEFKADFKRPWWADNSGSGVFKRPE